MKCPPGLHVVLSILRLESMILCVIFFFFFFLLKKVSWKTTESTFNILHLLMNQPLLSLIHCTHFDFYITCILHRTQAEISPANNVNGWEDSPSNTYLSNALTRPRSFLLFLQLIKTWVLFLTDCVRTESGPVLNSSSSLFASSSWDISVLGFVSKLKKKEEGITCHCTHCTHTQRELWI